MSSLIEKKSEMGRTPSQFDLTPILEDVVDWRDKSFPPTAGRTTIGTVGDQGWNALSGDLLFPLLVLKERALDHNIALMARYATEHAVSLAPHAKTTMAPQIVQRQLEAGAWGVTVATAHQARVFRAFGARRILLSNEVIEPVALQWAMREMGRDPSFSFFCLVDSVAGVALMEQALKTTQPRNRLSVLLEIGVAGGRAGIRTPEDVWTIAEAVSNSQYLQTVGIEGYEGAVPGTELGERIAAVDRFLGDLRGLTVELAEGGVFAGLDEIIVSAGGSLFFDRVVEVLARPWNLPLPVRVVLRSGSYVTHDVDSYRRLSPLDERGSESERLQPALEFWALVLSRPAPNLAIIGFGKRDAPYDLRLPIPYAVRREGHMQPLFGEVIALNDQHAYLRLPTEADLEVGDLVGFAISHPCTSFDKWRLIPLVDDDYEVTGAVRTFF